MSAIEPPSSSPARSADYVATVGSLFSGIGGLDLGLERAGMKVIWQSEIEPFAASVLAHHWPNVPNLGDIKKIDWSTVERPDVLAGGFPCQPVSQAGRRLAQADERWLWPEFARCIRELRPRFAIMENVPGLLTAGMGDVLGDLASLGYDAEWESVPAQAFGAPHQRCRVFIVAYPDGSGLEGQRAEYGLREGGCEVETGGGRQGVADTHGQVGTTPSPCQRQGREVLRPGKIERAVRCRCCVGDHWGSEPDVGRVADGIPARMDRLRCLGNAVVPQVAEWIGRQLVAARIDGDVSA